MKIKEDYINKYLRATDYDPGASKTKDHPIEKLLEPVVRHFERVLL